MLKLFVILSLVDTGYSSANFKVFLFREGIKLVDERVPNDEIIKDFSNHINKHWEKDTIFELLKEYQKHDIVYLNEYIFAKENGLNFNLQGDVDIEHIMPQKWEENWSNVKYVDANNKQFPLNEKYKQIRKSKASQAGS